MDASQPKKTIYQILPQDVISVPRAQLIYVIGDVKTPGGFVLNGKTTISLIEAVARAGGINNRNSPKRKSRKLSVLFPEQTVLRLR